MKLDRLISVMVAGVWLVAVFRFDDVDPGFLRSWNRGSYVGLGLIAVALIWYGNELGGYTGGAGGGRITQETPGCFIKLAGWILLVALIGTWWHMVTYR